MKCLITGASGFLGKKVLQLLVDDPRIEEVHLISRKKRTHPDPKVKIHIADLTTPWTPHQDQFNNVDFILHLAGLYQFHQPFSRNYQQNVLPVLNIVDRVRHINSRRLPQIFFASTYAVGLGSQSPIEEKPLHHIPPAHDSYAYTKALAERALSDSGLPARIFRLGILVGDTQSGEIEKIDGPYYLMRLLHRINRSPLKKWTKKLPVPLQRNGVLPLVPVDAAAKIIHRALFLDPLAPGEQEYYGVYHPQSISPERLADLMFARVLPHCRPWVITGKIPKTALRLQSRFTGIPSEVFQYSLRPVPLQNPCFEKTFGSDAIPHFDEYSHTFFKGFESCLRYANS